MNSIYGNIAVPVPGTPVPFANTSTPAYNIRIKANKANVGTVYLKGLTAVVGSSPKGLPIEKTADEQAFPFGDLALFKLDADNATDNVDFFANTNI